jgi:hypothetical protein
MDIAEVSQESEYECRICMEPTERTEVIAPCSCRGTQKWVHRACLDKWRTTREDKAFGKCTECLANYVLISKVNDSYHTKMMRRAKFFFYVLRDLISAFLVLQILIIILSSLIYVSDEKSGVMVKYFHSSGHIRLFYYGCGLVIFLAGLGSLYFLGYNTDSLNDRENCSCCNGCGGGYPFYCYDYPGLMCYDCSGGGIHPFCCNALCLDVSSCSCCVESCTCCGDGIGASLSSVSSEFIPVLIVLVVLLAGTYQ